MPNLTEFETFSEFCLWYQSLAPHEPLNMHEAATIYFNLQLYNF
jgi:hypothetical protein